MIPFVMSPEIKAALRDLAERAAARPVDMSTLKARLATADGKAAHMAQMDEQSIELPFGWLVTYSVETNHPGGTARHMSMSAPTEDRVPNEFSLWMTAQALGFTGESWRDADLVRKERLRGHGIAVTVIQLIRAEGTPTRQ